MEHDEKMASIGLKKHKYDLRYGSTPQIPLAGPSTAGLATAAETKEDKQIQILRLQIRLAELTQDHALSSQYRAFEGVSTPSSGISGISSLSYPGQNGFVDDNYGIPNGDSKVADAGGVSNVGADFTGWPDAYNFS